MNKNINCIMLHIMCITCSVFILASFKPDTRFKNTCFSYQFCTTPPCVVTVKLSSNLYGMWTHLPALFY